MHAIDAAAYTLHIGNEAYVSPAEKAPGSRTQTVKRLDEEEAFVIPPGQFAFLLTEERVKVPHDAIALISIKASIKFRGLVNVSGFHVDPGYDGPLIFSVFNAGPSTIHLRRGQPCFLIWYADLDRYSDKVRTAPPKTQIDQTMLLAGEVPSYETLNQRLRAVEEQQKFYQAVAGFVISVALLLLGLALKSSHIKLPW
ncbi:MAG TPA: hypothetical protein VGV14_11010 [Rhodanobacter sp.]|nr:hypothetical protein [Rhodanobacter sp.]